MKKLFLVLILLILLPGIVLAQSESDKYTELQRQIDELSKKLQETRNRAASLANQVAYMDNQLRLTLLKITETGTQVAETETEIEDLGDRIILLEGSLTEASKALIGRVVATYKTKGISPLWFMLSADGFTDAVSRVKYLSLVQAHDKKLMFQIQATKTDFEEQKKLLEEKKIELDLLNEKLKTQKSSWEQQKKDKEALLSLTKNDEKKYQTLLVAARAEQSAIESALKQAFLQLTNGQPVNEGAAIALMGNSGSPVCSTGAHLHFEVTKDGVRQNPAGYLKSTAIVWDNDPDGPFEFTGGWNWPMDNPRVTQGYGMTYWARTGFYSGNPHTGIDIVSSNAVIKAPKSGTLYRGSASCGGVGLNYVAIDHGDKIISWYWHVQ